MTSLDGERPRLSDHPAAARVRRVLDRLDRTAVESAALRIGGLVAERRAILGLSQRQLAAQCGTTQSAIARLEAGGTPPRLSTLLRLADALECDLVVDLRPRTIPGARKNYRTG